jgi:hypothetical protein
MTRNNLISKIAVAISKMEGFPILNSKAQLNKNPGNLRSWAKTPTSNGFAKFASAEEGWKALYRQVEVNVFGAGSKDIYSLRKDNGLTLEEFFGGQRNQFGILQKGGYPGYAPAADSNDPTHYAKFVAKQIGVAEINKKIKGYIDE